jgi:hypothetical protein
LTTWRTSAILFTRTMCDNVFALPQHLDQLQPRTQGFRPIIPARVLPTYSTSPLHVRRHHVRRTTATDATSSCCSCRTRRCILVIYDDGTRTGSKRPTILVCSQRRLLLFHHRQWQMPITSPGGRYGKGCHVSTPSIDVGKVT